MATASSLPAARQARITRSPLTRIALVIAKAVRSRLVPLLSCLLEEFEPWLKVRIHARAHALHRKHDDDVLSEDGSSLRLPGSFRHRNSLIGKP